MGGMGKWKLALRARGIIDVSLVIGVGSWEEETMVSFIDYIWLWLVLFIKGSAFGVRFEGEEGGGDCTGVLRICWSCTAKWRR